MGLSLEQYIDWKQYPDGVLALSASCCLLVSLVLYIILTVYILPFPPEKFRSGSLDNEYVRSASTAIPKQQDNRDLQNKGHYRRESDTLTLEYSPMLAWNRAVNFFCITVIFSYSTGHLHELVLQPIVTPENQSSAGWIFLTAFSSIFLFIAYWIFWPRWTLVFDREFSFLSCIFFALLEGLGSGLIIENIWFIFSENLHLSTWVAWALAWCFVGLWQGVFGSYYWNLYVLPEHDTPDSLKLKTFACHIPNLTITLTYLVIWRNLALFVFLQTFALVGCTLFMRFPSPFTSQRIHVATWERGACGFPRGIGYKDPLSEQEEETRRFFDHEEEDE